MYWLQGDDRTQLLPQSDFVFFDRVCCTWEFSHEAGAATGFEILELGFRGTHINEPEPPPAARDGARFSLDDSGVLTNEMT